VTGEKKRQKDKLGTPIEKRNNVYLGSLIDKSKWYIMFYRIRILNPQYP